VQDRLAHALLVRDLVQLRLEVTDERSTGAAAAAIEREHGRLDVLVNNAAIIPEGDGPLSEILRDALRAGYETNVIGLVLTTQAMLPLLAGRMTRGSGTCRASWRR
jgi:NAD(P)-dependent dehydrogenase (short-subunit alcohol dehydrogenase family)